MSLIPTAVVRHYKDSRSLVSITRDRIDNATIQGFVVDFDSECVFLQYVHDFFLDGWLLVRFQDMTSITCGATDAFQRSLLEAEGILQKVHFDRQFPKGGLVDLLSSLPPGKIVIVEDESGDEDIFLIGPVRSVVAGEITLDFFSGAARFDGNPSVMPLADATAISFDTNYTLAYERHFDREKKKTKADRRD